MRISDWSSDVCSSDLIDLGRTRDRPDEARRTRAARPARAAPCAAGDQGRVRSRRVAQPRQTRQACARARREIEPGGTETTGAPRPCIWRSEEHTSELQSLMRISYAVFCLTKKKQT